MIGPDALAAGRLCVVGNVNRDVKTAPIAPGEHLFEDGETSVEFIRETMGGGGANSALAAAALGAKRISFVGKIGDDTLGARVERTFAARGVTATLIRDPKNPTGTSINLVWNTGRRHFLSCLPTSQTLAFDEIDMNALDGHDHLLRADPWFAEPMLTGGGNVKLFEAARAKGLAVSLDINFDPQWGRATAETISRRKQALRDTLPLVDLAHGNVRELCAFADGDDLPQALARILGWGADAVVVHMGEQGAGYYANGSLVVEPCVNADRVVNTTGTGDVLSVCMMLLHKRQDVDVREKLRLANTVVGEYVSGRRDLVPQLVD